MFLFFRYPYLQFLLSRLLQKHRKYHGFGLDSGLPNLLSAYVRARAARARAPNESVFGGVFGARAARVCANKTPCNSNSNNNNNNININNNNNKNNRNDNNNNNNNSNSNDNDNHNNNNNNSNDNDNNNNNKNNNNNPTPTHTLFPGTAGGCVSSWIR